MSEPKVLAKKLVYLRDEFTGESHPIEVAVVRDTRGRIHAIVKSEHFQITNEEEL